MARPRAPNRLLIAQSVRNASAADRVAHLLLVLTVAGDRGLLMEELLDRARGSRATLYRDLDRLRRVGWRLVVRYELVDGQRAAVCRLAGRQRVPK